MNENSTEKKFKRLCERHGMRVIKMSTQYEWGIPDRLVLFNGIAGFCELKAPGEKPKPHQAAYIRKLYGEGCFVEVVDDANGVVTWIKNFKEHVKKKQTKIQIS